MAIEKHMLQTHSLFEKAGEVFEGVAKLKERIAELERNNHVQKIALEDAYRHIAMIPSIRRTLWLARAKRAEARKDYWYARSCHEGDEIKYAIDGSSVTIIGMDDRKFLTPYEWLKTWCEIEIRLTKKAKEYK